MSHGLTVTIVGITYSLRLSIFVQRSQMKENQIEWNQIRNGELKELTMQIDNMY